MYDAIIIGAGMSGLAAGIRAAYFEKRVCILERHYTIGGLNSFYRLRGRDYDVGLHAVTNFTPPGSRHGPLARSLRQLRFDRDEFQLAPQHRSQIAFPGCSLHFNNDPGMLESQLSEFFPSEVDSFLRLVEELPDYDDLDEGHYARSARQVLESYIQDPLLREMLLCPLMWYGNARQDDMDYAQFVIMFRSIFLEGFARPHEGVRLILRKLVRRFRELGGELMLRSGVEKIELDQGRAVGVELEDGRQLSAPCILSSAGWVETMRLCGQPPADPQQVGQLSFVETISTLDRMPADLGHEETIVFFNDSEQFHWCRPTAELCDLRTGVICTPNNFDYEPALGDLPDGVMRVTALADHAGWTGLGEQAYQAAKRDWGRRSLASAVRFVTDYRPHVVDTDMFTPRTIEHFTSHVHGAVYGAPGKFIDGKTPVQNLFLCGTDQGFVGIIGSIVSGVSMTNHHLLRN
ncbi:MAG: NAD(P)/FAD-dependent oxidoreductase [Planctomycetota bacterium]|nr:NAD(P)/FAD-dependent oxidoreductase [Planctomycetota bacterium]